MKIYCTKLGVILCALLGLATPTDAKAQEQPEKGNIRAALVRREMVLNPRRPPPQVDEATAPRIPCTLDSREVSGSVALKKCLDIALDAPLGSLVYIKIPRGLYAVTGTIECRSKDGVGITIEGPEREIHEDKLVLFMAVAELGNEMLFDSQCSNLNMRYIAFHGNKMNRDYRKSIPGVEDGKPTTHFLCDAGGWRPCNIFLQGFYINLVLVDTTDAPCGSGIGIRAIKATFYWVRSMRNGFEPPKIVNGEEILTGPGLSYQYGDGFTSLVCVECIFFENEAKENSDIGFAFGGGTGTKVIRNRCEQYQTHALACFSVGRFGGDLADPLTGLSYDGYHTNSIFERNVAVVIKGLVPYVYTSGGWFYCNKKENWCKEVVVHNAGTHRANSVTGGNILAGLSGVEAGDFREAFEFGEPESDGPNYFIRCTVKKKYVVNEVKPAVLLQDGSERYMIDGTGKCPS